MRPPGLMQNGLQAKINNLYIMTETPKKTLFLLDAYALIFRSYYAFIRNPRVTSKGLNTSAIFGFMLTLDEILQNRKPTHIAVVFDTPTPTFRHEMYKEYKAHRDATPEDIIKSVPYIRRLIEAYKIPILECPGYEADDVIGALSKKASKNGFITYMMTPDKDFAQLVSETVFMYKPSRGGAGAEIWGINEIKKEFCVERPEQVIDVLALMGDTADNIPGAPGIGPKGAMKLISEFGSVEELFRNTEKLKGKQKEIIENNKEQILFAKKLVTIELNVPVELNEKDLIMEVPDKEKLKALFTELEFKTIAPKILSGIDNLQKEKPENSKEIKDNLLFQGSLFGESEQSDTGGKKCINDVVHNYVLVESKDKIKELAKTLAEKQEFCFDTETTSINALEAELVAISFTWEGGKGFLIHFHESKELTLGILEILKPVFEDIKIGKTGQNLKYDIQVLGNYGIDIKGPLFDTMIAHYLLEPDMRHNMNILAETYLDYSPVQIESLIGEKGRNQKNMRSVAINKLLEYAVEDADVTWQLKEIFEPLLKKEGLYDLAINIEMPLIEVLAEMERNGIRLNESDLRGYSELLRKDILTLEQEIYGMAGTEFNISSPKQLGDILFIRLKLDDNAKKTKTKQFGTNEEILQRLIHKHPIIEKILEYRGLRKLLTTYVEALPDLVAKKTGRIHTSYNQAVASTGRLSSNNPNLQNIPVRDERGRDIRKAFVPADGYLFLSADYSQIELRLMAHLSKDKGMISDFLSGNDIHTATAAKIFKIDIKDVTREMRSKAKTANFGIIYGISSYGLSERLTISRKEAKELIDGYFNSYPGVKEYMDESIRKARDLGYVTTLFGRRRYVRDIHSRNQVLRGNAERNAINAPIQGTAADIIKVAMVKISYRLKKENIDAKMILQVHDELIFEVKPEAMARLKGIVTDEMQNAVKLDVPLLVECGTGKNWLEAH
jgi:DNA polymerase-1